MIDNSAILITGGTGSFGKHFVKTLLTQHKPKKIIIYSRDELKQYEMANDPLFKKYSKQLRFFIGDVRDEKRLSRAAETADIIVHAAALKQVPAAEYNPFECIKTNIHGAENVINVALDLNIKKVVALSTDKAAAPVNLYGATKLCSDKLFIAANMVRGNRPLTFSVVRYGNVLGSRGSVVPYFLEQRKSGKLSITSDKMTRFNITLDEGVQMVVYAIQNAWGGEIFVPKIPSYKILDVAKAVSPNAELEYVGIRPGEKIHEEMITESDALNTVDCGKYFVILPSSIQWDRNKFIETFSAKTVSESFRYNSGTNDQWLTPVQLRSLIKEHVDPTFEV